MKIIRPKDISSKIDAENSTILDSPKDLKTREILNSQMKKARREYLRMHDGSIYSSKNIVIGDMILDYNFLENGGLA